MGNEDYTHFISIPLATEDFLKKMVSLKSKILDINQDYKDYFVPLERLHITILMLYLPDDQSIRKAADAFGELAPRIKQILGGHSLEVKPKKLGFFSPNGGNEMKKAKVLHLELEDDAAIKKIDDIVDLTIKHMLAKDVVKKDHLTHVYENRKNGMYKLEKLHVTLMKVARSEKMKKGNRKNNNDFESIDVHPIITELRGEKFGGAKVKSIDLSTRDEFRSDGFYQDVHSIQL
jgi:2'-5' RNA ligase